MTFKNNPVVNLIRKILHFGTDPALSPITQKKIYLANQLTLSFGSITFFFWITHVIKGPHELFPMDTSMLLIWASVPTLNYFGLHKIARLVLITIFSGLILVLSSVFGKEGNSQYTFYVISGLGLVLFEAKDRWAVLYGILLPPACFATLLATDYSLLEFLIGPHHIPDQDSHFNIISGFLASIMTVTYFYRGLQSVATNLETAQVGLTEAQSLAKLGSWDWNLKSNAVYVSDEFRRLIYDDPSDHRSYFQKLMARSRPEDQEKIMATLRGLRKEEGSQMIELHFDEGDKTRHISLIAKSSRGPSGIVRINGYIQDVTDLREAQKTIEVQQSKIILASKMSSLGEMAGGMAHEINTPLAVILLQSKQIKRLHSQNTLDDRTMQEKLDVVDKMATLISKIIKGLQAFARGGEKDPFNETPVKRIIDDTLTLCTSRFEHHEVQLKVGAIPEDLTIECRSSQMIQVLVNLFNNAYDAVSELEEKWVKIECIDQGNHAQIIVTDSGSGIPEHIREKLMQPFFTTKEVGKGTGLGLSISKGIIESHNGHFFIDPNSANTRFVIELPKVQGPETIAA